MTITPLRPFIAKERGATAVEFALVVGVLIAFLMGALEFGRALHARNALDFIADRAARSVVVDYRVSGLGMGDLQAELLMAARANAPGLRPEHLTVILSEEGGSIRVEARYDFVFLIPLILIDPITLTAERLVPAP